jgi:hypothetical protein
MYIQILGQDSKKRKKERKNIKYDKRNSNFPFIMKFTTPRFKKFTAFLLMTAGQNNIQTNSSSKNCTNSWI